jgi:pimeloyl-ACP methyl ester carboxylesterase
MTAFPSRFCCLPDITLHVVEAGPADGPVTILLHGFPEFWWAWRAQIDPLARAGLRVVVPDQRGYNLSSKPAAISSYRLDALAKDVIDLADAYEAQQVNLVGHDWGGIVAAWLAGLYPSRVNKLILINAPHAPAASGYIRRHPGQMLKSAYISLFQIPVLPEFVLSQGDHALLARSLVRSSRPGTFSATELARYREAWSQPGALTTMLNWYRALSAPRNVNVSARIGPPTRMLWGKKDAFLQPGLAEATIQCCERGSVVWFENASHWVHHEEPDTIAAEIIEFLGE